MCSEEGRFEDTSASFESILISDCREEAYNPSRPLFAASYVPKAVIIACMTCDDARRADTQKSTAITPLSVPSGIRWARHGTTTMHTDNAGTADTKNICSTSCAFAIGGLLGCAGVILIGKAALHIMPRVGRGLAVVVAGGRECCT